jgi:AcrR family transcriptional regulator
MARLLKEDEYNAKRDEILGMAQHLMYTKGYDEMTIQDVLEGLHISKGALYHYFHSKEALLEALVERMGQVAFQNLSPITQDGSMTAIQKFQRFLEVSVQWKGSQKELISGLLSMWFSEKNASLRQRIEAKSRKQMAAFFEPVITQGIAEGSFSLGHPKQAAAVIAGASLSLADMMTGPLLLAQLDQVEIKELEETLEAYVDTIERILGAPAGCLHVFEAGAFEGWLAEAQLAPTEK